MGDIMASQHMRFISRAKVGLVLGILMQTDGFVASSAADTVARCPVEKSALSTDSSGNDAAPRVKTLPTVPCAPSQARAAYSVDHPLISYSGYIAKEVIGSAFGVNQKAMRFNRSLNLNSGKRYGWDTPGVRISFRTDSASVVAKLYYSDKHISTSARNGQGLFFIDGETQESWTFNSSSTTAVRSPEWVKVSLAHSGEAGFHDYEIVLPFGDSVEFCGLELDPQASLEPFQSSRTLRYLAYGDSVTQGFSASRIDKTYPYLLAKDQNWEALNLGMAGRASTASDGAVVGGIQADIITVLMGVNNWQGGTPLAQYRSQMVGFLTLLRAQQPDVPVYLITPLWVDPAWNPPNAILELESYRVTLRDIASQLQDNNLQIIEGPSLIDPENKYFNSVAVHPNDAGFAMLAQRLEDAIKKANLRK